MRAPALTAAAMLSIGMGIAATAAVFSVADAALLRAPAFESPDHLVILYITRQKAAADAPTKERWSWARFQLLQQLAASFRRLASFSSAVLTLTDGEPETVDVEIVSPSYLATLGVQPLRGHSLDESEEGRPGSMPQMMLGFDLWRRRFGGDPSIVGREIALNGLRLTVTAILPPGFAGLSGRAQIWVSAAIAPRLSYAGYLTTNQNFISVVGRLRDGVGVEQARAALAVIGQEIQRIAPSDVSEPGTRVSATAVPLAEARIDPGTRRPIILLFAAASCLLLLACANVAGLLLGRALSRRREIAVRLAAGATRGRIVRQLLVEASLLTIGGCVMGLVVAAPMATRIMLPAAAPAWRNSYGAVGELASPRVDLRLAIFCAAVCTATTLTFGLFPAFRATRVNLARDLKDGAGGGEALGRGNARALVVGIETAMAVVLLFVAGMLIQSWWRLTNANMGFDPTHLVTFMIRPSEVAYPPRRAAALVERVLAEVQRVPGVEAASVDGCAPAGTGCASSTLYIAGRREPPVGEAPPVLRHYVGPDHFRVMRVPLLRGRVFDATDRAGSPRVAVINESAARRFWPNQDPIGQRVWFGGGSSFDRPDSSATIVGVVGDVAYQPLDEHPLQADFYTPYAQFTYATRTVLVRTRVSPEWMARDLRLALRRADPTLALSKLRTMDEVMGDSRARITYQGRLLATFAIGALLLAATGIFAVIAHAVSERRREIGIRTALGATPAQVIAGAGSHGVRPAIEGAIVGLVAATLVGRVLSSMIYGVRAVDPVVVAGVVVVVTLVIGLSACGAARRAVTVGPAEALRTL